MILQGSQRGGAKDLALHLLKTENEHVDIHELRGFVSDDLVCALNEAYAISRGTKAKQFLFSVSFNPPTDENVPTSDFEAAIDRVEQHFGLVGQPRAIVFHEKKGADGHLRRHAHAVWSRIDAKDMKAIPLPFTKRDLTEISRELFIEHGWKMPRGFMRSEERDPRNFTMAEWQQAKRSGKDPREIKTALRECWAISDNQVSFKHALSMRGFYLARGDRRGFVVLDHRLEVYNVAKWTGFKTKDIRAKLGNGKGLPSVAETKTRIASEMQARLETLKHKQSKALQARQDLLDQQKQDLIDKHKEERRVLEEKQAQRQIAKAKQRQERFNKGLLGFWDRLTGKHRKIKKENEAEFLQNQQRDATEKDALIFKQKEQRQFLQSRIQRLQHFEDTRQSELAKDIKQYRDIRTGRCDAFEHSNQPKRDGPKLER